MARVENSISLPATKIIVVANYSALPDPTTVSGKFYWAEASQGTPWLPGSLGGTYYGAGMYYSNGVSWSFVNVPYQATEAEVIAGINTDKFVTPSTLAGWWTNIKTLAQTISGIWTFTNGTIYSPLTNPTYARGLVFYDNTTEGLAFYDDISGTTANPCQEEFVRARNNTGATILNGSVVYVTGALGQNPTIGLAKSDDLTTAISIGIATHDIANNTVGKVTTFGIVNDINTASYTDGQLLYLSPTTAGGLTTTAPSSPNYTVYVCIVLHAHVTQGKLFVRPEQPIALDTALTNDNNVSPSVSAVKTYVDAGLAKMETFIYSKANGTFGSHTGTTAETVIFSSDINAGEFTAGDFMTLMYDFTKVGIAGTATIRFRAGTAGTTADALIGTGFFINTVLDAGLKRERFQFLSGNILSGIASNYTSQASDINANTVVKQSTSLTPSNAWKLSVTVQLANAGDTVSCVGYRIGKIKSF